LSVLVQSEPPGFPPLSLQLTGSGTHVRVAGGFITRARRQTFSRAWTSRRCQGVRVSAELDRRGPLRLPLVPGEPHLRRPRPSGRVAASREQPGSTVPAPRGRRASKCQTDRFGGPESAREGERPSERSAGVFDRGVSAVGPAWGPGSGAGGGSAGGVTGPRRRFGYLKPETAFVETGRKRSFCHGKNPAGGFNAPPAGGGWGHLYEISMPALSASLRAWAHFMRCDDVKSTR